MVYEAKFLLPKKFEPQISDVIKVQGLNIEVKSVWPRHNIVGQLDHWEIEGDRWAD